MPNKHTTDGNYRYAFQGQEKDGETDMEAFELRLWDGRLGRWLTVDPYHEFHSPYVGMGNNPINLVDPDGGSTDGDPPPGGEDPVYNGGMLNEVVVTYGESNYKASSSWSTEFYHGDWYDYSMTTESYDAKYGAGAAANYTQADYQNFMDWQSQMDRHAMQLEAADWFNNVKLFFDAARPAFELTAGNGVMKSITGWANAGRKTFTYIPRFGSLPKYKSFVKMASEDDVLIFSAKIGDEAIEGISNFVLKEGKLYLNKLHVQGSSAGNVGRKSLWDLAKDIGRQFNVKEVIIQGGKRTTGKYKGTVPSPVTIKIN